MTPEEIQAMAKGLAEGQAVWYVLSACIGGAIAGLGTYLAEKGKNRATKEDIADITRKVKEVEDVFNRGLSDLNAHHQLRMVAAERRMQAHQEAYMVWQDLNNNLNAGQEKLDASINKGLDWYTKNCLFLGEGTRKSIHTALQVAGDRPMLKESRDAEGLKSQWAYIIKPLDFIFAEVSLPNLSQAAREKVDDELLQKLIDRLELSKK